MPPCNPGYRSDDILRIPMHPFFPEEYGKNCDFVEAGYLGFGIPLVASMLFTLVILSFLIAGEFQRKTKKLNALMYLYGFGHITLIMCIVQIGLGFFETTQWLVFPLMAVWGFAFGTFGSFCIVLGKNVILKSLADFKGVNVTAYLENRSKISHTAHTVIFTFIVVAYYGLLFSTSFAMGLKAYDVGFVLFRCWCGFVFLCAAWAFFIVFKFMGNFANAVEDSLQKNKANISQPSSQVKQMKEVVWRFRYGRFFFCVLTAVPGCGQWFIHTTLVPYFWWSFLFQMLSTWVVVTSGVFIVTSSNKLRGIIPCYKGIVFFEKGNETSSTNSKGTSEAKKVTPASNQDSARDAKLGPITVQSD